ncbi:MAG: prolipoprotein diacylglyceryl transferase [Candidatus Omnitrophota bacterium]
MHPIICKLGPFSIYSYGLMLAIAFLLSVSLAKVQAKKEQIDPEVIFNFSLFSFLCGIIGARIFYIVENIGYYFRDPLEIFMLQHGGLSWFGGLIGGFIFWIAYLKKKRLPLYKTLDLIAPFLALAQAIGRIGCLLNGCCFGKPYLLIPVQLYSSLALLVIFIILRLLQERPHRGGEVFFTYLLLYSLKRFSIEFYRADNPPVIYGLTLFQLLSLLALFFSLIKLILIKRKKY